MAYFSESWASDSDWSFHRKPYSGRWDPKRIDLTRHPPWRACDDDPNADGEMPQGVKLETLTGHKFQETVKDEQSMPKRVYLNKNHFEEHCYRPSLGLAA